MAKDCGKCSEAITGIDSPVVCRGYCGATLHMNCAGVTRAMLTYFTTHKKNLFWMCDKCAELFENSHFKAISVPTDENGPFSSLTTAITELRSEIQQLATKSTVDSTPKEWPLVNQRITYKRKRDGDGSAACKSGLKQPDANVVAVPTSNEQLDKKFWLYLSRIRPDVSNEAVCSMVKANLELESDPVVVKLVPKGKDISTLSFVSFKIGIDDDLKTKALDPATWPEGILFREFEDYGAQAPTKFAKFLTPNSHIFSTGTPVMNLT